jgi:hypothetical protein
MHATIRRYDGVDQNRTTELTSKVNETLVPKLNKLPGFVGYYLIEDGNGVFSSLSLFETREQAMESTKFVATWIREEKLDTILPNEPKITSGQVVAHSDRVLVAA